MQGFLGGDKGGSSNPLKQIMQREGQDRGAFRVSIWQVVEPEFRWGAAVL